MADIVLSTLNARFIHASFGLRYLLANLGELQSRAEIVEFEIKQSPIEIVEALLARHPRILGLGVYIWNVRPTFEVVALLKQLRPEIVIVLGGPEVSHEWDRQPVVDLADHTITGEADLAFAELCRKHLNAGDARADSTAHHPKVIHAALPDLARLTLPYRHYTDADLAHRVLYVEASRGCPFSCEFCLSSLDVPVRAFPLAPFLAEMRVLLGRGARHFKFVDRTFNLHLPTSQAILRFFRDHWVDGLLLHFEMIPDRLPEALREEIAWFPPGALQFEIGIQSFNPDVCARISRRQDLARTEDNLRFLRNRTGVHLHTDLIAGLPGETLESFADGFDRLVRLGPQEIQFGILKRLRGTPIVRHDAEWRMRYSPLAPYEILESATLDFATLQRLRRFARYWDLVANSGRFPSAAPLIWPGERSPFWSFLAFSDWLHARTGQTHGIALERLAFHLCRWLVEEVRLPREEAAGALAADWRRLGNRELPAWLAAETIGIGVKAVSNRNLEAAGPNRAAGRRQARHLGAPRVESPPA